VLKAGGAYNDVLKGTSKGQRFHSLEYNNSLQSLKCSQRKCVQNYSFFYLIKTEIMSVRAI